MIFILNEVTQTPDLPASRKNSTNCRITIHASYKFLNLVQLNNHTQLIYPCNHTGVLTSLYIYNIDKRKTR